MACKRDSVQQMVAASQGTGKRHMHRRPMSQAWDLGSDLLALEKGVRWANRTGYGIKQLREENERLKKRVAKLSLDKGDVAGPHVSKVVSDSQSASSARSSGAYRGSERHACRVLRL